VIDRRTYSGYGHTSFGASFDRGIDAWVRRNFRRVATFTAGSNPESAHLEIWRRTQ
jgi:hypothetical protein